ncbi:hypothetical protein M8818_004409 [Zalaria obscura]|uniref:Uncharacterized protein n=1 Tax=Zalaria obscura TaxID=2024903 RepID=A0ACC3SE61_9PEZI
MASPVAVHTAPHSFQKWNTPSSESDMSSIISIGDHTAPSDTDVEEDTRKYRLPDIGKTRLHRHTKQEFEDVSGAAPRDDTGANGIPRPTSAASVFCSPRRVFSGDSSDSDFHSRVSRAGSIYSISRESLTSQLSQLTSIRLPNAASLSAKISSLPTSIAASSALSDAAEQIARWMQKASEVLNGLDAEDDIEWAAAGGREGLEEVDNAITRFDSLVKMYVVSIEQLQMREDIGILSADELQMTVHQMERILKDWQKVKETLRGVKEQVEVAMEWEELWTTVLGDISEEIEELGRVVFEMEEKRHQSCVDEIMADATNGVDINQLSTIVEESPKKMTPANKRFSNLLPDFPASSPIRSPRQIDGNVESNLLSLFARMQPLRASLDFLPMRLSVFHCRGNQIFPTACIELESRRDTLEDQFKKLESDAESLRKELSEDRWVLVFRNAGKQAMKMRESLSRSHDKLRDAIHQGEQHINMPAVAKMIESYEAKRTHYAPAIERVLAIIDRGVLDRLTVNGEILRLQSDMKRQWNALQADMRDLDLSLDDVTTNSRNQQLRDSISTILSSERSMASSLTETPKSSPASSVVLTSRKSSFNDTMTPTATGKRSGRASSLGLSNHFSRRTAGPKSAIAGNSSNRSVSNPTSLPPIHSESSAPPKNILRPYQQPKNKPRFSTGLNGSPNNRDFSPLSATEPSPYRKAAAPSETLTPVSKIRLPTKLPMPGSVTEQYAAPAAERTPYPKWKKEQYAPSTPYNTSNAEP